MPHRLSRVLVVGAAAIFALTSCAASQTAGTPSAAPVTSVATTPQTVPVSTPAPSTSSTRHSPSPTPTTSSAATSSRPAPSTPPPAPETTTSSSQPSGSGRVIVIDPGHSVSVHGTDPGTGLDVSDYENEPEMRDMFAVALLVRARLQAAGYRVYLTKNTVDQPESLGARADLANRVHADLALSLHDQAGANGGLPFRSSNNTVYYQSVGTYRETPSGHKVYFTNSALAAVSKRYGEIFQSERQAVENHPVRLLGNTGYNLGSRGLAAGDIWIVQLLSHVPWIYNEAGGNSPGMVGLDATDKATYAAGVVAGVEHCVAPH